LPFRKLGKKKFSRWPTALVRVNRINIRRLKAKDGKGLFEDLGGIEKQLNL